jgi:hypothetical protein
MNPAEQKSHKNVTDTLRADLKQLCEDHDALDAREEGHYTENHKDITNLFVTRATNEDYAGAVRAITDLRTGHDDQIGEISFDHRAFVTRGFWSRFNWLLTGR